LLLHHTGGVLLNLYLLNFVGGAKPCFNLTVHLVLLLPDVFICSEFAFEAPHKGVQFLLDGDWLRFRLDWEALWLATSFNHLGARMVEVLLRLVRSCLGAIHFGIGSLSHLILFLYAVLDVPNNSFLR
jgi:hypothetical protein